ncbi:MAG TPA: hypothetical protein VK709_19015, partial [Candidatus Saccharimonadales bacterium]|nr:hypothetical protein [Candidatus Saccharimonadales bacterium]
MSDTSQNTVFGRGLNPNSLDLLQIVNEGQAVVWRLSQAGSQLYYGTSDPTSAAGYVTGEFYVNSATGTLFQLTAAGTWIDVNSFGPRGFGWLSGAGVPSPSIGVDGDLYLNTLTGDVYTKTSGSWGSPIENLTGPV